MSNDIREAISYCPVTGAFRWRKSPNSYIPAGNIAGCRTKDGYWQIRFRGKNYRAHRLAWFIMTGAWPVAFLDHKNLDRLDNRWSNLREATAGQNSANTPGRGRYGKGVALHKPSGRFQAQIKVHGKNRYIGLFDTPELANAAYAATARSLHGEYARSA